MVAFQRAVPNRAWMGDLDAGSQAKGLGPSVRPDLVLVAEGPVRIGLVERPHYASTP